MRAALYIRVSTNEQAKEGYSIPAQKERLDAFAKSQGWTVTEYYLEEGESGKDLHRPAMKRLLADIESGGIDVILIYRLDRLTRSVVDLHALLQLFEKNNVAFRSVTEIYDTTTATGRLFITLVAAMAQWERENLGERVYFGMAEMARQGRRPGTKEPYGYRYADGKLLFFPEEAKVVRQIYNLYLQGNGFRKIVRVLNNSRIPTKTGKTWTDNTLSVILTNPLYKGMFKWDGELYKGQHEPIIDDATWQAVQNKMAQKKSIPPRHAHSNYPLTGILKCGLCGSPLNGCTQTYTSKKGKQQLRYYKCGRRDHKGDCDLPYLRAEIVEAQVLDWLGKFTDMESLSKLVQEELIVAELHDTEIDRLQVELRGINGKKKKWFDAYEAGVISVADLHERLKLITERETYVHTRLKELTAAKRPWSDQERLQRIKNLRWLWNKATPQEQKELAHELIKSITADENKTIRIILN